MGQVIHSLAARERQSLADLMVEVGPEAPTLCEGWQVKDLAAHLVLRESRPDAAPGIFLERLSDHTQHVMDDLAGGDFRELVARLRGGPPWWSPMRWADPPLNTAEFFVHHEDVRRAAGEWRPRVLPAADAKELLGRSKPLLRRTLRGVQVTLVPTDGPAPVQIGEADGSPELHGDTGDLVLWAVGRSAVNLVGLEAVEMANASRRI